MRAYLLIALVLALALGGCGSGGGDESPGDGPATTQEPGGYYNYP